MRYSTATIGLLLVLATAPGCSGGQPGAGPSETRFTDDPAPSVEPTEFPEPSVETGVVESPIGGGQGAGPVAVELPGLPVGGGGVEFQGAGTLCVDVSWSGTQLPPGAHVAVLEFAALEHFAFGSGCDGLPPCLGGDFGFTVHGGTCGVEATWDGVPSSQGSPVQLAVARSRLTCEQQPTCDQAQDQISGDGTFTIDILWNPTDGTSSDPGTDDPTTDDPPTADPSTDGQTDEPATGEPSTEAPGTGESDTGQPTSEAPATEVPPAALGRLR